VREHHFEQYRNNNFLTAHVNHISRIFEINAQTNLLTDEAKMNQLIKIGSIKQQITTKLFG